jgi:hypothetical protein
MTTSEPKTQIGTPGADSNGLRTCSDYGQAHKIGRRAGELINGEANPFLGGHPDAIRGWADGYYDGWSSRQIGGHRSRAR